MTTKDVPAIVPTVVDDPMDFTVVARDPSEMAKAQKSLILWAARKIQAEKELLAEAEEQRDIAAKNKWRASGWKNRVRLSRQKIEFYKKIKVALEAGYYIVPPFPIEVFAIRTDRRAPDRMESSSRWDNHRQRGRRLPAGEGRYVSDLPAARESEWTETKDDGKKVTHYTSWANRFRDVDFPFKMAKPAVLNATAEAMALKVFDRMGVLPQRRAADPIVCGQIIKPGGNRYTETAITFFVAWWLDTKTL